jgi:hypothetical protein
MVRRADDERRFATYSRSVMYPHLELEENRRELERERTLRRQIRKARLDVREQRTSSWLRRLTALRPAFRCDAAPSCAGSTTSS